MLFSDLQCYTNDNSGDIFKIIYIIFLSFVFEIGLGLH
jgi:hypothetical protein